MIEPFCQALLLNIVNTHHCGISYWQAVVQGYWSPWMHHRGILNGLIICPITIK